MIYAFIDINRSQWPIRVQCRVLDVSASGFYAWQGRQPSNRVVANQNLLQDVRRVFWDSGRRYGVRRVRQELKKQGQNVGHMRIAKIMRDNDLRALSAKRVRVTTTDSNHDLPIADNVLDRNFGALAPNEKWAADITYIPTDEGWVYLAIVLDLFSKKIVGWAMREHMRTELPLAALMMALQRQKPEAGFIHHSDRGSQYASHAYRQAVEAAGAAASMSRKGNCWDNAPAESFFHTLKTELVHHYHYATKEDAKRSLFHYIEGFYNTRRIHSALGYKTPLEMEVSTMNSTNAMNATSQAELSA
jgi:transposase InsO family protein